MIDADRVRRATSTTAARTCCSLLALLMLARAPDVHAEPATTPAPAPAPADLPWLKARPAAVHSDAAVEENRIARVETAAEPQPELPWLKTQPAATAAAEPAQPARPSKPAAVPSTAVAAARVDVVVTPARRKARAPLTAQQYAATLRAPLSGARISSPFGSRRHPVRKRRGFHYGVDYAAPTGTPILAAQDGEISLLGSHHHYGRHLRIDHGHGVETLYGHLRRFVSSLKQGATVKRGDVIGYVGASGRATGPHLHFEVLTHGQPVDPMKLALAVPPENLLSIHN